MRKKRVSILILILLAAMLLVSGTHAMSSENYAIHWMVPLTGGGGAAYSESYAVNLTIGQTAVGPASSSGYSSGLGYWFGIVQEWLGRSWRLHVPLILRQAP
jgi:hypothetical protein